MKLHISIYLIIGLTIFVTLAIYFCNVEISNNKNNFILKVEAHINEKYVDEKISRLEVRYSIIDMNYHSTEELAVASTNK